MRIRPGCLLLACVLLAICGLAAAQESTSAAAARKTFVLECETESSEEYAGVKFLYTINERAKTIKVSRWGEPVEVVFGAYFITYRTLGMALKMRVSLNRANWQFTMIHEGGEFVVNGGCKELPPAE